MSKGDKEYRKIISHYEHCFDTHGDNHKGMDWPKKEDALVRYQVMLQLIRDGHDSPVSLLDFGCGTGHLFEYLSSQNITNIKYSGLDISKKFIDVARNKFPMVDFYCHDILDINHGLNPFDYIVMNGVFTEKRELSFDDMWTYCKGVLKASFSLANNGLAFNVMSKAVDWERWDLFHLSTDLLIDFICKELSRNFVIRNDYGLYEYTVYIYR